MISSIGAPNTPLWIVHSNFYRSENSLLFMYHYPEVQIGTLIIYKKRLTSRVAVKFEDETRYCTSINHLPMDTPL